MLEFLKKLFHNPFKEHSLPLQQIDLRTGKQTPVEETEAGKLFKVLASGKCPACNKKTTFYEGPSGGLSTNIFCSTCNTRFNITPMLRIAERV